MSNLKLREVIKQIRQCKTAAEERGVVAKESALIRNSFREVECDHRNRNIAKLLFFNLLGYPTAFGQVECTKLVAASTYTEKRIGYLGINMLMDQTSDVLMLVTNQIKRDLNARETYISALGLTAIAECSTEEMCRELYTEVIRLMRSSSSYIRTRAGLAAIRTIKNIPDVIEDFQEAIEQCVEDKHQSVLLATVTLCCEIVRIDDSHLSWLRRFVGPLCRQLKNLLMSGYAPEYEIGGVKDPFLQVKIIELLGCLGKGHSESSDEMSDVLAQIATNTETSKNTGNSVLAECVRSIMLIEASQGLRVLAINILGRFLANKENNVRFVALQTLMSVVEIDYNAVQRQRPTITECLKDHDLVIKKQALDLLYKITNAQNVRTVIKELLNYLLLADAEFKKELANKICQICEKYAPTKKWHVDTVIKVLSLSDHHVREEYISQCITVIATEPELHQYSVAKVFFAMKENINQMGIVQLGCWLVGEFGEMLVDGSAKGPDGASVTVSSDEIIEVYEQVLDEHDRKGERSDVIISWALTALSKLTIRLANCLEKVREIVGAYTDHANAEIQQRACEYVVILNDQWTEERNGIFEPILFQGTENMLVGDLASRAVGQAEDDEDEKQQTQPSMQPAIPTTQAALAPAFDLDSMFGGPIGGAQPAAQAQPVAAGAVAFDPLGDIFGGGPVAQPVQAQPNGAQPMMDPLGDIFGNGPMTQPSQPVAVAQNNNPLGDIFGSGVPQAQPQAPVGQPMADIFGGGAPMVTPQVASAQAMTQIFADASLAIDFTVMRGGNPGEYNIKAYFSNTSMMQLSGVTLQVAVQKYMRMTLQGITSTEIAPGSRQQVTQDFMIVNSQEGQKPLALKIRVSYNANGQPIVAQKVINNLQPTQ